MRFSGRNAKSRHLGRCRRPSCRETRLSVRSREEALRYYVLGESKPACASLARSRASNFFAKACSQILRTRHPHSRSCRFTLRSRARFREILASQYPRFESGLRPCSGQPCQKHPSTKTASFLLGNTKSGRPGNLEPRRHPIIRCIRKIAISLSSVSRFPDPRIVAITSDRFLFEKTSIKFLLSAD